MRLLPFILLAMLSAASIQGQDALQSLKEILSKQKPVNWVQTPTNPETPPQSTHVTATITDVTAEANACKLSFKDGRVFPDQRFESLQTWQLKIPDVELVKVESLEGFANRLRSEHGQPGWATKTTPTVFVLEITAASDHKFDVHRWHKNSANEVFEKDLNESLAFIVFGDEASAREAESALQAARASCANTGPR